MKKILDITREETNEAMDLEIPEEQPMQQQEQEPSNQNATDAELYAETLVEITCESLRMIQKNKEATDDDIDFEIDVLKLTEVIRTKEPPVFVKSFEEILAYSVTIEDFVKVIKFKMAAMAARHANGDCTRKKILTFPHVDRVFIFSP